MKYTAVMVTNNGDKAKRRGRGEGSVTFLESRGVYVASIYVGQENGKPKYLKAQRKTKTEATKALNELKARQTLGKAQPKGQKTLGVWLDEWLEESKQKNAPKTYRFYEHLVRLHIKPALGTVPLRKLDAAQVADFLARKRKAFQSEEPSHQSPGLATLDAIRRTLRAALNAAKDRGLIGECPVNKSSSLGRITKKPARVLTPDQATKLIDSLKGSPIEHLAKFVLFTGLRVGEATGLCWSDFDLRSGKFHVHSQLQRQAGSLSRRELKTEKSRRELPLLAKARPVVEAERSRQLLLDEPNALGLVFTNPQNRPLDPKYVDDHLKAALKRAELPPMGMHGLRHTAATIMLMGGVPMAVVSRLLGHSSITLTVNTYGHLLQDQLTQGLQALEDAINE